MIDAGITERKAVEELRQGRGQGHPEGHVEDGHLDRRVVHRCADLRSGRPAEGARRRVLHRHGVAHRGHRPRRDRGRGRGAPRASRTPTGPRNSRTASCRSAASTSGGAKGEYHLFNPDTVFKLQHSTRAGRYDIFKQYTALVDSQAKRLATLRGLFEFKAGERPAVPIDEVEPVSEIVKRFSTGAMSYGSISKEAHENLAIAMNRIGASFEHRRRRRGPRPLRARRERRPAPQRDQAGRDGPLRGDERVPRERRRPADQDGAGREAGRGRRAARPQGVPVDRQDAALDAGRRPDLAAAAPRHLFDRGSQAADPRPEEREQPGARAREARRRGRRRHGRRGRVEGARRRRADLRPRRRHRRGAAHVDQARGRAVGARPRRDAADVVAERVARPHRRAGRRPAEDRPRRRDRARCSAPRSSASRPRRSS